MTSRSDEQRARRPKALELRLAGATYEMIAQQCGYASRSGAYKAVQVALEEAGSPATEGEELATELARLDAMLIGLWGNARRGDVQAIDRVLKISERREQLKFAARQAAIPTPTSGDSERTGLSEFERRRQARQASG